jgi:hypothetical protein
VTEPTVDRFRRAVDLALTLPDPVDIYRAILAGSREVDDGLRATGHGGGQSRGGERSSHPERQLERRQPGQFPKNDDEEADPDAWEEKRGAWNARTDRARDDMLALNRAATRVLDCMATLNAECCDAGQPDTWAEALQDAHLLLETGTLQAAIDVGRHIDATALRFCFAVDTVRAVRDSWMAHDAPQGMAETNQAWCRPHLRIDVKRPRVTKVCCQQCWRDIRDLEGQVLDDHGRPIPAVELQTDPTNWPSEAMQRAREDGRRVLFEKEQAAWMRSRGVDPHQAHQRRQQRRSA